MFDAFINYLIALGALILITAALNVTFGTSIELWQSAAFYALFAAVRHNPPPFGEDDQ